MNPLLRIGLLVFALLPTSAVFANNWAMVEGSVLTFMASYQGEPVPGEFRTFTTRLVLDENNLNNSALNVDVDISSLSLNSVDLEDGAATAEWFYSNRYPRAEFRSNRIRQTGSDQYEATGLLNLKGITRTLTVPFTLHKKQKQGVMEGRVEMVRTLFNIGSGEWANGSLIGLNVVIVFKVKLHRID